MKSKSRKKQSCMYNECCLPENNNVYLIQLVYAIITAIILGANEHNFTLTSILLYIAPFLIDLTQNSIKSKAYGFIKGVLMVDDILLLIFAISGIFLVDEGEKYFTIKETAMLFRGFCISKQNIFFMCFANILVPLLLYKAVPCKKTLQTLEQCQNQIKAGSSNNLPKKEVSV